MNVDGLDKRITSTGETIVYSDRNDEKHHGGVAIRDRPFNLKGRVMVFCFVQNFFFGQHKS